MERRGATSLPAGVVGTPLSRSCTGQRGNSLIELLVSTVFLSILSVMSYSFARAALMSARVQEVKSEAQEVTVMALDVLARELRMAGFSAASTPISAVRVAALEQIAVASDFNGDGDVADTNELIAYSYSANNQQLMRATGGGSPQPLVRNVPPGGLRFQYFDATGAELAPGGAGLSEEDRQRVQRIDVRLLVVLANPDPRVAAPLTSTVVTSVCLRNSHGAS